MNSSSKKEADRLLRSALPFAKKMLSEHGEFYPYGEVIEADGRIVSIGVEIPGEAFPKSKALAQTLDKHLKERAQRKEIIGSAAVLNVKAHLPGKPEEEIDAIQLNIDVPGYSARVFVPYSIGADGHVEYGEIFACKGNYEIFGA